MLLHNAQLSPVDALQWLLDLMRARMQPRLDNGKIGIVQLLRAEDSPVRALMAQYDDCFREWYAFFADAMLVQGGMSLMQFMRYAESYVVLLFQMSTILRVWKVCSIHHSPRKLYLTYSL